MGSRCRFVSPDVVTLPLSGGDSITVKKRLTEGERRAEYGRLYVYHPEAGRLLVDPTHVGLATVIAYLLEWTFTDREGRRVDITDKTPAALEAILLALEPEDFAEVLEAVTAHESAMAVEREQEKKTHSTTPISDAILSSVG